jgi:hypothetical protein
VLLVVPFALAGCGSDNKGITGGKDGGADGGGVNSAKAEMVCTSTAKIRCAKLKTCWETMGLGDYRIQRDYGDLAGCEAAMKATCLDTLLRRNAPATPEHEDECVQALDKQSCTDYLAGRALPPGECPGLVGTIRNGQPCVVNNQCRSNYCGLLPEKTCGTCADKADEGMPCEQNSDCRGGLTCPAAMRVCTTPPPAVPTPPRAPADAPCMAAGDCEAGLTCVGFMMNMGTVTMMGACKPINRMEGAPCDPRRLTAADCDTNYNLYCRATSMKCEKRILARPGEPCNSLMDGTSAVCAAGANCVRPLDPATNRRPAIGTCTADVGDGIPCYTDGNDGPGCQAPLRCVLDAPAATTGKCRKRDYDMCAK